MIVLVAVYDKPTSQKQPLAGELAGVLMGFVSDLDEYFERYRRLKGIEIEDERLRKEVYMLSSLRDQPIFRKTLEECSANKILGLKFIAVSTKFRARGVATALGMER